MQRYFCSVLHPSLFISRLHAMGSSNSWPVAFSFHPHTISSVFLSSPLNFLCVTPFYFTLCHSSKHFTAPINNSVITSTVTTHVFSHKPGYLGTKTHQAYVNLHLLTSLQSISKIWLIIWDNLCHFISFLTELLPKFSIPPSIGYFDFCSTSHFVPICSSITQQQTLLL